jgi:hypothetical protein
MDRKNFLEAIAGSGSETDVAVMRRIFEWADEHGLQDTYGAERIRPPAYAPRVKGVEWDPIPFVVSADSPIGWVVGATAGA